MYVLNQLEAQAKPMSPMGRVTHSTLSAKRLEGTGDTPSSPSESPFRTHQTDPEALNGNNVYTSHIT